jgi:hypothetical protein
MIIKENKDTKYSPLFDMYSLDMKNVYLFQ